MMKDITSYFCKECGCIADFPADEFGTDGSPACPICGKSMRFLGYRLV